MSHLLWGIRARWGFVARTGVIVDACRARPSVIFEQRGAMRLRRDGRWLPFDATAIRAIERHDASHETVRATVERRRATGALPAARVGQ